jgi:hypothetical protein
MLDRSFRWYKVRLLDSKTYLPTDYIFRGPTSNELSIASTRKTPFDIENFILSSCVLGDHDWNTALAGVSKTLLELILSKSLSSEGPFTEALEWFTTEKGCFEAAAVSMIPGLDHAKLRNSDPSDYAKYILTGKFLFETLYGMPVMQAFSGLTNPTPNEQQLNGPQRVWPDGEGPGKLGYDVETHSFKSNRR